MNTPENPDVIRIFLSRRNLQTLLSKLDRALQGEPTACTLIKHDNVNPTYPQTIGTVIVTAVEDSDYYTDRVPGAIHESDEENVTTKY